METEDPNCGVEVNKGKVILNGKVIDQVNFQSKIF